MNAERLTRLRECVDAEAQPAAVGELLAENDRLRGAIRAHREAYGGIEMPCPHELRAANRQLWATIEEK